MRWAYLLLLVTLLWPKAVHASEPEPINAVLGDLSWTVHHPDGLEATTTEQERIETHLEFVEEHLRRVDASGLSPAQQANRVRALDALARYRRAGIFPKRTHDPYRGRRPQFIDERGVHCAVGEMIRATGSPELAEAIDREHEYDYVEEMDDPLLLDWADRFGFTVRELAMIQPTYGMPPLRDRKEASRASLRAEIDRRVPAATLACMARYERVPMFDVRAGVLRSGRVMIRSARRDPYVRCMLDELREDSDSWDRTPWPYRARMTIQSPTPESFLEDRIDRLQFDAGTSPCLPRPGVLPGRFELRARVGPEGPTAEARTSPSNPEVDRCLTDLVLRTLEEFGTTRWSAKVHENFALLPRVRNESVAQALERTVPGVATECFGPDAPRDVEVWARANKGARAFEVGVLDGGQVFRGCLEAKLAARLEVFFSVHRVGDEGELEPYFRIDADAFASDSFRVWSPEERSYRPAQLEPKDLDHPPLRRMER